jgi:hypothetical protein
MFHRSALASALSAMLFCTMAFAESPQAIASTIDGVLARLKQEKSPEDLMKLRAGDAADFLSAEERKVLAEEYLKFNVNVPSVVTVWKPTSLRETPFWISEGGYTEAGKQLVMDKTRFEAWEKPFAAGTVALGYCALDGFDAHYFVTVRPQTVGESVEVSGLVPDKGHSRGTLESGARIWSDDADSKIDSVPEELAGQKLVRAPEKRARETMLVGKWRQTGHPSHARPDQITLTWSDDPTTTQTVQWRMAKEVPAGQVKFKRADGTTPEQTIDAEVTAIEDKYLVNDSVCHHFTATMRGLEPDTEYSYQVGGGPDGNWSDWINFSTAPKEAKPFRFVYMGDAQNGLDEWGRLVRSCFEKHPDAHFYIMAGDLVNRGQDRDDWDDLFFNGEPVYSRRTLVPAVGNHEMSGSDRPGMYLSFFDLPENGSPALEKERSYAFKYSNALFVVLDSNDAITEQSAWLEEQLANTDAKWKFLVYHHPAYSSAPARDNAEVRKQWAALCDKYHVDLALQGHDHAYLRTYPMHSEKRVATPADGTIYIVSVSGTKFYEQDPRDYTEFGMTKTATFQLLDIQLEENKLTYNAYDVDGNVKDTFVIEK